MKHILLTLLIILAGATTLVQAQTQTSGFDYTTDEETDKPTTEPNRGHRMPPAPVMAVVDMEAGTVSGTSPLLDGIVSYQIWEANGSLCIADASDIATAFKAVDGLHGTYMLRMRGDGYTLTGHIDL